MVEVKASFSGSIPEHYDNCLGPAFFNAFAKDLAHRIPPKPPGDVLEIACGTGLVTKWLRDGLDPAIRLVATDISKAMLEYARGKIGGDNGIEWREADAARLPFGDGEFGAVVCAFGVMYVADRAAVFTEARRVLKDGGTFLFNVWDRIEENVFGAVNAEVIEGLFPGDREMRFRTPYEMYDKSMLRQHLAAARFQDTRIETKRIQIDGISARTIATGQIRGTPRSLLIEKRGFALDLVVDKVTSALAKVGGADPFRAAAQAIVIEAHAIAQSRTASN